MKKKLWTGAALFVLLDAILFGLLVYQGKITINHPSEEDYPIRGVDVSYYQGEIDWEILAEENIDFAFIKATEGSSHIDTKFKENWEQSGKTRLKRGAYHFFSFESTGEAQAEHFISVVPKEEGMLSPVVDIEFYGDRFYNKPDVEETRKQLQSLLDRLEEYYGVKPLIYATESSYSTYIRGAFDEYPLWIRNIYFSPNMGMPGKWTFWQYDSDAKLQGYSGEEEHIDLNVFYGSEKEWTDFLEDHSISVQCDTTLIQNR
ncbi:MAG: glycoside hydrolase family 25 protein [Lachnospiraceae bacterium]|jgi:lysozyme|nr:glycoside hydrolase family 25 protein [Lachnospiraceae bacterium]